LPELQGNKAIENAAVDWVMQLERRAGRTPQDTRYSRGPADLSSPPRLIEIKAFGRSNRGYDLWLEVRQVEEARCNHDFFVYVVENVRQGDPSQFTLKVLGGDLLTRLLTRAKEQRYFTVPWPVADYDAAPTVLESEGVAIETAAVEAVGAEDRSVATPRLLAGTDPRTPEGSRVTEFKNDDPAYMAWVKSHRGGWVVNTDRIPKARYLQLHKASCPWISDERVAGAYTERQYIKYCAEDRQALDSFFQDLLDAVPQWRCPACK
jgi:hypothetical protein